MKSQVVYQDLGLSTLSIRAETIFLAVLEKAAFDVMARMQLLIIERFYDTGATANSVAVYPGDDELERLIGPSTHYAVYGEYGFTQVRSYGQTLATPIVHPGKHFMRDALAWVRPGFINAVAQASRQLGGHLP